MPDVNVLIYAYRPESSQHALSRRWLAEVVTGDAAFGVSPLALSAVVRITSNPRIFQPPSGVDDAFGFCQDLIEQPHCQIVEPGERHWDIFRRLCVATNTRGRGVTDAWFAALAIEWGCEWITFDADFARFPGLNCRQPKTAG